MQREHYIFRIVCVYVTLMAIFALLVGHVYHLQIVRHDELLAEAKLLYTTSVTHTGSRGLIYDRHGNLLVGNLACKTVLAEPRRMGKQLGYVIECLGDALDLDTQRLKRRFSSSAIEVVVARNIDLEVAAALEELALPGIRFVDTERRFYPKQQLLANVLGFTDHGNVGAYGLEEIWNDVLAPRQGREVFERDRKGQRILTGASVTQKSLDGRSVFLTIDEPIQHIVETELDAMVAEHAPERACAIMVEPSSGAVLAMAQWPSYDPNDRQNMDPGAWRNHMISDVYDPGSTMKCMAIAGAIDFGVVHSGSQIDCENGYWYYGGRPLRDSGHRYGVLSVSQIIEKSSNIGAAKIGLMMGEQRLYQTLRRFGFGSPTGIGLAQESAGILRGPATWDGLSITRFPIGQGVSVTPLQMVQAYAALANDGYMMQLYLVDRTVDPSTRDVQIYPQQGRRLVARQRAVRQVVAAMVRVTGEGGTASNAAVPGYTVAGKTGTSQKLINGSYTGHGKYIASFIGFAPAADPAFTLLVLADSPSNGRYYGGSVAAPTFRRIAEQTLRYLNVQPDIPEQAVTIETAAW